MIHNGTDDELHFRMPGVTCNFADDGDKRDAIPTTSRRERALSELERFDLASSDVDGYEGEDGDCVDEENEAPQADDVLTLKVEE